MPDDAGLVMLDETSGIDTVTPEAPRWLDELRTTTRTSR